MKPEIQKSKGQADVQTLFSAKVFARKIFFTQKAVGLLAIGC